MKIWQMYSAAVARGRPGYSLLQDVLSGIRVVKAFGQEEREARRFIDISQEFARITSRNEKTFNTLFPFMGYLLGSATSSSSTTAATWCWASGWASAS